MLPVFGAVLLCAQSLSAFAADSTSTATKATSDAQVRVQGEAKRDRISGADKVTTPAQKGASTLLDEPVNTDDAPRQEQH
ncbi:hypothetical protein [Pseudomonas viridiflava]|uniref:hypothetical protein n=1 Tax=Pseudomonas viridiflava TaxID=33069 RepID=UPI000F036037|nr:hypothetical protein [Pseudomonas viridiflava]